MSQTFNCPNCNAPLDIPGNVGTTIRCPYCESSVVVPEELRSERFRPPSFSLEGMQVENLRKAEQQEQLEEIMARLRAGDKIGAIKAWREAFDTSLKVSKEAVEALERGETVDVQMLKSRAVSSTAATRVTAGGADSYGAGISPATGRKVAAAAGGTGCFVVGLVAFILFVTFVPMFFAFTAPGGPLAEPWARINPFGKARVELSFGGEGTGVGVFEDARHVAVDNNGHIFVGEYSGGRIQVFDESGKFITQWLARGEDVNNDDVYLVGMAADRNGVVYVTVAGDLFRYNGLTGELLGEVPYSPEEFDYCDWVTVAPDGSLLTVWSWHEDNIIRFDRNLNVSLFIPSAVSSVDDDDEVERVAVDGAGTIYALGTWESSVYIFSSDGRYVNRFGSEGDEEGQFTSPYAIAVDNQSRVYVSDFGGLLVFASDGRYLDTIPVEGYVYGITFDDANRLYVVTSHEKVLRYTAPDLP